MVDKCISPSSTWRWPSFYRLPKKERPMDARNCARVYRASPMSVTVQIRLIDEFAQIHLTMTEARELGEAILEAAKDPQMEERAHG